MLHAQEAGRPYDAPALQQHLARAVAEVVRQQAEYGLDIVSDGEQLKTSFTTYLSERLVGIETRGGANGGTQYPVWRGGRGDSRQSPGM
jgi:5-methyltetrahydropteroyltriglutamate--homocysteine methyltransferase